MKFEGKVGETRREPGVGRRGKFKCCDATTRRVDAGHSRVLITADRRDAAVLRKTLRREIKDTHVYPLQLF